MKTTHRAVRRSLLALSAIATACLISAAPAAAQSAADGYQPLPTTRPATASLKPAFDLSGIWWAVQPEGAAGFKPDPPLKPDAMKVWMNVNQQRAEGKNFRDKSGLCLPLGMPLILTRVYPIQVFQTKTMITIIHEYENNVRWIYIDGRPHPQPDDLIPTYMGHSIGWWEGDTLVVDTIGMNTEPDIEPGVPHTESLHLIERIKMTKDGFVDQITMDDPKIFEKPWVTQKTFKHADTELQEYHCLPENNHFGLDENGVLHEVKPSSEH